jgi:GNAT superfamily N-acetyltransferase
VCALPPAEIDFSAFPPAKPRIVGYAAKWETETFESVHTPRRFEFSSGDASLLDRLRALAVDCWRLFGLAGYARVDFRVDAAGQPWILEVNANPCLSPGAGFAAALARAEIPWPRALHWILGTALRRQDEGEGPSRRAGIGSRADTAHSAGRLSTMELRTEAQPADRAIVREILTATMLFRAAEIDVAVELVDARLAAGPASGYEFVFAEQEGHLVGYVCFGKNALTLYSFEVYWMAVRPEQQGRGIGRLLLEEAERRIGAVAGTRIYLETSGRADYQTTRAFYERCGYRLEAVVEDFYGPGDSKAIYVKAP